MGLEESVAQEKAKQEEHYKIRYWPDLIPGVGLGTYYFRAFKPSKNTPSNTESDPSEKIFTLLVYNAFAGIALTVAGEVIYNWLK